MRWSNTPAVDIRYWTIISIASICGCNLGDFVARYLHCGHWLGLGPLTLIFVALLFAERRSASGREGWYWAGVIVLRTAATNLADLCTHDFGLPYAWFILGVAILLIILVLKVPTRLVDAGERSGRPATDGWYWASLLTAGTLGTGIGDWVAEGLHVGTGPGSVILGAITAVVLTAGARSNWSTKSGYWPGIVAVRSAGTTAGDFLAFQPGVGIGLPLSTGCSGILFIAALLLWPAPPRYAARKA